MSNVEFYAKLKIRDGKVARFKEVATAIIDSAAEQRGGTLRCDWYLREDINEAMAMVVYLDEQARSAHFLRAKSHYDELAGCGDGSVQFLGEASNSALAALAPFDPAVFKFAYGLAAMPTTLHRALGISGARGIEVYTRFDIFPGHLEQCRQVGAELIPIVSSKDPGTTRYDWFYNDEKLQCMAMDAYADAASMFAHMKNAHDVHELLFDHATMITEFLGELPQEARAAVARYQPYITPLFRGLK